MSYSSDSDSDVDYVKQKTNQKCEHYFTFGERRENETCLGSHRVKNCSKCGISHSKAVSKKTFSFYDGTTNEEREANPKLAYCHEHVWDIPTGRCGSKLCFPDYKDENGLNQNYGYQTTHYPNGACQMMEISERRRCKATLVKEAEIA
jgi:hypothetical protein